MINSLGFCCVNVLVHNARIRPPITTHSIHLSIAKLPPDNFDRKVELGEELLLLSGEEQEHLLVFIVVVVR